MWGSEKRLTTACFTDSSPDLDSATWYLLEPHQITSTPRGQRTTAVSDEQPLRGPPTYAGTSGMLEWGRVVEPWSRRMRPEFVNPFPRRSDLPMSQGIRFLDPELNSLLDSRGNVGA